jgi:hypothetical protein
MKKKLYLQDIVDGSMRGVLSLFTAEIQDVFSSDKLSDEVKIIEAKKVMQEWIDGCKLTPEKVKTAPKELSERLMRGEVGIEYILEWMEEQSEIPEMKPTRELMGRTIADDLKTKIRK